MIRFGGRLRKIRRMLTKFWIELSSSHAVILVAVGFAAAVFVVSECMHYLLVPDLGRHAERLFAEAVSALMVGCLAALLFRSAREHHEITKARLQVIAEVNHHIRDALTPISLSAYLTRDYQSIHLISEGVKRIDWALREILPRQRPLSEPERDNLNCIEWQINDNEPIPCATRRAAAIIGDQQ